MTTTNHIERRPSEAELQAGWIGAAGDRLNRLSTRDGSPVFHHGINNAESLAWLGIHDLHDAYRWYNDHIRRVPYNAIRVLRVAQSVWPHTINTTTGKYSAVNAKTGRMKLLPKLRKSPINTNDYARHIKAQATQR